MSKLSDDQLSEKCVWCGETERKIDAPDHFACGSASATDKTQTCCQSWLCVRRQVEHLEAEVARLEALLAAALRARKTPELIMWGDSKMEHPEHGYWVRIGNGWRFAGSEPLDAIALLAGIGK